MQLINVFFKGTLYQDLSLRRVRSLNHTKDCHAVRIHRNRHFPAGEYKVNSGHHQAVKESGAGLKPFAFAPDGVLEAFYHQDYDFLVGVQWHPERLDDVLSRQIFTKFSEACGVNK
jgi:putative glutamine amidotransferase